MNDSISRQAAIDALDGEITVTGRANAEAVRGYANLVCDRIKRLPSAQPEQRWIPCSERLPDVSYDYLGNWSSEEVLLLMNDEEFIRVCNGHFNPVGMFEVFEHDGIATIGQPVEDVKAWMPLPEPYKERREE